MPKNKSRAEGKSVTPETAREVWRQGKFGQPLEGERQDRAAAVQGVQGNLDSEAGRLDGRIDSRATISQLDSRIVPLPANDLAPANGPIAYPAAYTLMYGTAASNWPASGIIETVNRSGSAATFQRQTAQSDGAIYQRVGINDTTWSAWSRIDPFGYLALTGGAMSGTIVMGGNGIFDLATPTSNGQATRKDYVDSGDSAAKSYNLPAISPQGAIAAGGFTDFSHNFNSARVAIEVQAYTGTQWSDGARFSVWGAQIDNNTVRIVNGDSVTRVCRVHVWRTV